PGAAAAQDPFRMVPLPNGGNHGVTMPAPQPPPAAAAGAAQQQRPPQQQQAQAQRQPALIGLLAPGTSTMVFQPGAALLVKAGTTLTFQIHYTANGTVTKDQSSIGFIFAKQAPRVE